MVPFLAFLLFFLLFAILAYTLTVLKMKGAFVAAGPARVGASLRGRNRVITGAFLVVLVVVAVLEALIPDVSAAVEDLQYRVGDLVTSSPVMIYETGNGTISWGLYLAVLVGVFAGLAVGTVAAVRRYPVLRGLGLGDLV